MPVLAHFRAKKDGRRGAEILEFTFVMLPLFIILFAMIDASWAIFAKSTLMYAVRSAVRYGVTITGTQATAAGETLTQMVKDTVQSNSLGFVTGTTKRAYIQVHYFAQDSTSSTGLTDVSTQTNGNAPGNLIQVSVNSYPLPGLTPRIYGWLTAADHSATTLTAVSADVIEPSGDTPTIGTAP